MNTTTALAIIFFAAAFAAAFYANENPALQFYFTAPYHYTDGGDLASVLTAFFFVFICSLLFFGKSAPIALGIEGLKYASLFFARAIPAYDLLYAIPEIVVAYSATVLGAGALGDFKGNANVFDYWREGAKYFLVALILTGILFLARPYLILSF